MNARKTVSLAAALLIGASFGAAQAADNNSPADTPVATAPLTRAEVLADLEIWRLSGMAGLGNGDADVDPGSPQIASALAKYHQMLESPEFAQRVMRIARKRGEAVELAVK